MPAANHFTVAKPGSRLRVMVQPDLRSNPKEFSGDKT
jgi:hypothetical protein